MPDRLALVTGGAGLIGSHLADLLIDEGWKVRILDNLEPQTHGHGKPPWIHPAAEFVLGDVREAVVSDRRHLAETGIIVAVLALSRETGAIVRGPDLLARGFMHEEESGPLFEEARKRVVETIEALSAHGQRIDFTMAAEEVRRVLRRHFDRALERKPVVIPILMEM